MRTMKIDRFFNDGIVEFTDLGVFMKRRLMPGLVMLPDQAVALVGYMAWPNDPFARREWIAAHRRDDQTRIHHFERKLKLIQQHWARAADILHLHYDLATGGHQRARGGASVGKAIELIDRNAGTKGTGAAQLWKIWKVYKEVAHLVTAAVLLSADAQTRHRQAPFARRLHEFQPYRMAMLMPDLVLAVAMSWQDYGFDHVSWGGKETLFNPETLWRIPEDLGISKVPLPPRKLTAKDIHILNVRRAGNRGTVVRWRSRGRPSRIGGKAPSRRLSHTV